VFTDITTAAASDSASTFAMFNGTAVGKMVYLGSDFKFSGAKVKIVTEGVVEPANVVAEYWNGTAWFPVNYMATCADFPFSQKGWEIAGTGTSGGSEQWRFNYDPYGNDADFQTKDVNGSVKYWARFRITSPITTDPLLEQVKLHTNSFEINANGFTEYFGTSRYKKTVLSGINNLVNNSAQSLANESAAYAPGISAGYKDNEFQDNTVDSTLFVLDVNEGIDTSIPVEVNVSWYVKGAGTGDVELSLGKIPVGDGFVYDGANTVTWADPVVTNVPVASNLVRQTTTMYIDINEAQADTAYLMVIRRDASAGNTNDTVAASVVATHIKVNAYFWKP